jgi:predicted RNA methylase
MMKVTIPFLNDYSYLITDHKSRFNNDLELDAYKQVLDESNINNQLWLSICNPYNNILFDFKSSMITKKQVVTDLRTHFPPSVDAAQTIIMMDVLSKNDLCPNRSYPFRMHSSSERFDVAFNKVMELKFEWHKSKNLFPESGLIDGVILSMNKLHQIPDLNKLNEGAFVVIEFKTSEIDKASIDIIENLSQYFHQSLIFRSSILNIYKDCGYFILKHKHDKMHMHSAVNINKALLAYNNYLHRTIYNYNDVFKIFSSINSFESNIVIKRYCKRNTAFSIRLAKTYNIPVHPKFTSKSNALIYNIYNIPKYFKVNQNTNTDKLILTKEAVYSMSKPESAEKITGIIINSLSKRGIDYGKVSITDATANVGGNVINFAHYFKEVNAIEPDSLNFKALKSNISAYNLHNVHLYHSTYNNKYTSLRQDIVFVDPPWGGLYYNYLEKQMLHLDTMCMLELFDSSKAKCVVYKLPINFDFNKIMSRVTSSAMLQIELYPVNSFIIMIIYKKLTEKA